MLVTDVSEQLPTEGRMQKKALPADRSGAMLCLALLDPLQGKLAPQQPLPEGVTKKPRKFFFFYYWFPGFGFMNRNIYGLLLYCAVCQAIYADRNGL